MPFRTRTLATACLVVLAAPAAFAQTTFTAATEADLRNAISTAAAGDTIRLASTIALTADLPSIASSITFDGAGHTLSGQGQFRGLVVAAWDTAGTNLLPVSVTIQNLTIANTVAAGGDGGDGSAGGGGGAGLGGAIYVAAQATVTISNVSVASSSAVGGDGGSSTGAAAGGGGGGLGGDGGSAAGADGGGGGGAGSGATGGTTGPGGTGILTNAAPGGFGQFPGGANGGGGGSGVISGAGGGAGGFGSASGLPGAGGYAGGGGGGSTVGGAGGFGGGGGGSGNIGGAGGYGAGGGGSAGAAPGAGGLFGGAGAAGGGGGAGLGGAIFVQGGGAINVAGPLSINGSSVTAGAGAGGGGNGSAFGAALFFGGSGLVTFTNPAGTISVVGNAIADEAGTGARGGSWVVAKAGGGTLVLAGNNSYSGGTAILGGTLQVAAGANLGFGDVAIANGSTLAITGSSAFGQGLRISDDARIDVAGGASATWNGLLSDNGPSGRLLVTGGGALALTNGGNSYSGGTFVFGGGTLAIGSDAVLGDPAAGLALGNGSTAGTLAVPNGSLFTSARAVTLGAGGGVFDIQGTAALDLAGSVSGAGSLSKLGSGVLTLSGSNAYTGNTIVGGGILRAGATNVVSAAGDMSVAAGATLDLSGFDQTVGSLSGAGAVVLGPATLTTGGNHGTTIFSGAIGGAGSLVKSGSGVQALLGTSTYTGGTTVLGGTLLGTASSLQGDIVNHALVVFDQAGDGAYTGVMSGSGSLVKTGAGSLRLTGANTYSGGTIVSAGTLAGTTTSLQGDIVNDALVVFDQSEDGTWAGAMSGGGTLAKTGSGTLFVAGALSHTGGTRVSAGTLAGTAATLRGAILNDATVAFIGDADGAFNGVLGGSGSFVKTGAGTLSLSGTHPLSGGFQVSAGGLALEGIFGGSVDVSPGATFTAAGTVLGSINVLGTLVVPSPMTVAPAILSAAHGVSAASNGDALETPPILTVGADFNLLPGSVFSLPLDSGPNPTVFVGGRADLNGARLDVTTPDLGATRTATFLALTAREGLTTTGLTATSPDPLLVPYLRQDATSLFVTMLNFNVPLTSVGGGRNASSVAEAIDRFKAGATGDRALVVRELTSLEDDDLRDALRLVSGEPHASSLHLVIRDAEMFTDFVRGAIQAIDRESDGSYFSGSRNVRWWLQGGGEYGSFRAVDGLSGGTVKLGGSAGGFDWRASDRWTIGAGGGLGGGSLALADLDSATDFTAPRAFAYAGFRPRGFGLRAGGSFARSSADTARRIRFIGRLPAELGGRPIGDGIDRLAESREISLVNDQWSEYEDEIEVKTYKFEWFAGVRRASFDRDGAAETGADALALLIPEQVLTLTQADVKVHVWRRERTLRPFAEVMFRRELTDGRTKTLLQFVDLPGSEFQIEGFPVRGNSYSARGGMTWMTRLGALTFEYQVRHATGQTIQSGDVRVRFR